MATIFSALNHYVNTHPGGEADYNFITELEIIQNEFEVGKDYYTISINYYAEANYYTTITYHVYTSDNTKLPAVVLTGNIDANGTFTSGAVNGIPLSILLKLPSSSNISSTSRTEYEVVGQTSITNADFTSILLAITPNTPNTDGHRYAKVTIDADFPLFMPVLAMETGTNVIGDQTITYDKYSAYDTGDVYLTYAGEVATGDITNIDKAINFYDITNAIPSNKVWSIQDYFKANGTITNTKGYDFKILPDAKIAMYVTNQIEGDASPNAHIVISEYPCMVKPYNSPDSAYSEASSIDADYWWGEWQDTDQGITYIGYGSTNIPIFESQEDAQKYFDGELTIEDAINGGDTTIKTSTIGDYLDTTDIPTINMASSGVGVYIYALSEAQIKDIMGNYLYTTDPATQTTIEDAIWLWGNNPIDFMVDCYYIPFDISSFYSTINANLKFGTYQFTGTSFPAVKETNGNRLTLFNTTFEGIYGDWRDYTQFNYDLYLPFYGFVPLDIYRYLNHTVKCEMMFDLTTHNVRYYLYVDGKITDRIDTSVGISIPLMATDMVNKAKHDRDIRYGVLSDSISAGTSIGMGVTSADFGGAVTGIISGVSHIISGVKQYQELNTQASQSVHGGYSSSMNVYDIMYAYLRITERQAIIPSRLNTIYNYPSYYMGALSSLSGYCEIEDVQLYSNATEQEQEEIKTLLRGGVIF